MSNFSTDQRYRPGCVTVYAVLLFIGGVINLLGSLANLAPGGDSLFFTVGFILAILAVFTGVGLWQMKLWGWWSVVILQILAVVTSIFAGIAGLVVSLIINGGIFYWFYRNQRLFEEGYEPTEEELKGPSKNTGLIISIVVGAVVILPICAMVILALLGPEIAAVFNDVTAALNAP